MNKELSKKIGKYRVELLNASTSHAFIRIENGPNGEFWSTLTNIYKYILPLYKHLRTVKDVKNLTEQIEEYPLY